MQLFDLVEVGVDAVGHKVAEVRLAQTDAALAGGGVRDIEVGLCHSDLLAQHIVHSAHPLGLDACHSAVQAVVSRNQLGGDGAVCLDGHLTHIGKVRTGLGQGHCLAGEVLHPLALHHGVGVAVDECVQAGGVLDDFLAGPGRRGRIHAQMAQADDIICDHACLIDGLLHGVRGEIAFASS